MRTRNLMASAVCTIVLIVGVAWLGNGRPESAGAPSRAKPQAETVYLPPPDDPPVTEASSEPQRPSPPVLDDLPRNAPPDAITQPVEPHVPAQDIDTTLVTVPPGLAVPGANRAFRPDQLDEQPVASFRATPDYPWAMRQSGLAGEVLVDFVVDSKGRVRNVRALRSSRPEFEEPACRAVAKWRFRAGRKDGICVAVHMQVPVVFSLEGAP